MSRPVGLSDNIQTLLSPRQSLCWGISRCFMPPWARPVLIDNIASRNFYSNIISHERCERSIIRDHVEETIAGLSSDLIRFWNAEFCFIAQLLSIGQLALYAPSFIQIVYAMPTDLVRLRRFAVKKYVNSTLSIENVFVKRQKKIFVRSCVLFYPADLLFRMSDRFTSIMENSADQSMQANRKKVIMSVRALQFMSDTEICNRFRTENEYMTELEFLQSQCKYFRILVSEIYRISGDELRMFWISQIS